MRISSTEAALLNVRERELVRSKGPWHVRDLAVLIRRTRDLRDKQRGLIQRQTIATARRGGGKAGRSGSDNARTVAKEHVLARALEYFEEQLAAIDRESSQVRRQLDRLAANTGRFASETAAERKPAVKKSAARKSAARTTAARKIGGGPVSARSKKARVALPKSGVGSAPINAPSLASRRTHAKKSR